MAINHDPDSEDFKTRVQAYIMFFRNIGIEKAAEFCVHQDATIEGLQANNDSFVVAYHEAAQQSVQRTACAVPHPQADFEFICDLCGEHVPARRRLRNPLGGSYGK